MKIRSSLWCLFYWRFGRSWTSAVDHTGSVLHLLVLRRPRLGFRSRKLTAPPFAEERGHECVSLCPFSDFPMQLNLALFEFNGRTGYMLKHDVLRRSDKKFDPFCDRIDTVVASTLTIKAGFTALLSLCFSQWTSEVFAYGCCCMCLSQHKAKQLK